MSHCLSESTLQALADGSILETERAAALTHLEGCDQCRALAAALARGDHLSAAISGTHRSPGRGNTMGEAPSPEQKVGRYLIRERIGAGAMGVVYSAWDPQLGRRVALKVLRPPGAPPPRDGELSRYPVDEQSRGLLLHEARAAARLAHPNVIAIFDVVEDGELVALAMEFVEGGTLQEWMAQPSSWQARARMLHDVGQGLACLHAQGLVHRDFKPANVLVGADARPRVGDFGLVHLLPEARREGIDGAALHGVAGTPAYMAPEQLRGETLDARADVYAFCVTAWQVFFGERPSPAKTWEALLESSKLPPPPAPRSELPPHLIEMLRRGLEPEASRRPSMTEVLSAFALSLRPPPSKRPVVLALVLLVALLGGAATFGARWVQERRRCEALGTIEQSPGSQRLQAWASDWSSLRTAVCLREGEAESLSASSSGAAEVCLDGLRPQFHNLVAMMSATGLTDEQHESLERLTPSLTVPSSCLTPSQTARSSPEDAAAVLQAIALREVGKTKESMELATSVLERDGGVDPATALSMHFARAMALQAEGLGDEALVDFAKAAAFAEVQHDDSARAAALVYQASTLLMNRHDDRAGLLILESARPLAERAATPAVRVELLQLDSELANRAQKPEEALALVRRARELAKSIGDVHLELSCISNELVLIADGKLDDGVLAHARELMSLARTLTEKRPAARDAVQGAYTEVLVNLGASAELIEIVKEQLTLLAPNQTAHGILLSTLGDWQLVRSAGDVEAAHRALERLPRRGKELDFLSTEFAVVETECRWLVDGPERAMAVLEAARKKNGSALTEYTAVLELQLRFARGLPLGSGSLENSSQWDLAVWRTMAGLEAARAGKLADAKKHLAEVPLPDVREVARTIPEWGSALAYREELRALVGQPADGLDELIGLLEAQPSPERSRVLARLARANVKRDCVELTPLIGRLEKLGTDPAALSRARQARLAWRCP